MARLNSRNGKNQCKLLFNFEELPMMTAKKTTGIALAAAAAALFAVAPMGASAGEKAGKCFNINSCKGTSACATATTSCAGQNSCAGQGWVKRTKSECEAEGGKFEA
jgi:hypothetical protein